MNSIFAELSRQGIVVTSLRNRANRLKAQGSVSLHASLNYEAMFTLSIEARQKLARIRPATLAQAGQIPGISPADLQNLLMEIRRTPVGE